MKGQSWYRVELSPAECVENGKADQLQKAFEVMFVSMLQPGGAALFEWFDDRLETNVFYFSPEAAFLLRPLIGHLGGMDVLLGRRTGYGRIGARRWGQEVVRQRLCGLRWLPCCSDGCG
jgi:hypothetical protein